MKFKCISLEEWTPTGIQVKFKFVGEKGADEADGENGELILRGRGANSPAIASYRVGEFYEISPKRVSTK